MHKIDSFTVVGNTSRELLFAWTPSSHLARAPNGRLFVEYSSATKHLVVADYRSTTLEYELLHFPAGILKRYGTILVQLDRNEHDAVLLPQVEWLFEGVIAQLYGAADTEDNTLPFIPGLVSAGTTLAKVITDWRNVTLAQHPGRILFPGPNPQRYAF